MKRWILCLGAAIVLAGLSGCANRSVASSGGVWGRPAVGGGLKKPSQVSPCCRDLAEGKITLAECMERPQCKANNRTCCMNAF